MSAPFHKEQPEAIIECYKCKAPLWRIKVLTKWSHRMEQFNEESRAWDESNAACPLCARPFFELKNGLPRYKIRSVMNGKQFTL